MGIKEELILEEVTSTEWLNRIQLGEIGFQSENSMHPYDKKWVEVVESTLKDNENDTLEKWVGRLDDGYRTFYIIRKKDWYGN